MQQALGLVLLITAGYFLLKGSAAGGGGGGIAPGDRPVRFINAAGQEITQAVCGDVIGFEVDGFTEIWLIESKDGQMIYNDAFITPMQPYALRCPEDVGNFTAAAYQRASSGPDPGPLIGYASITVLAPGAAGGDGGTDPNAGLEAYT